MKVEIHKYKPGYYLELNNGKKYSIVDLGGINPEYFQTEHLNLLEQSVLSSINFYDELGGRYEGMLLPESNNGEWGEPIRSNNYIGVIKKILEENNL